MCTSQICAKNSESGVALSSPYEGWDIDLSLPLRKFFSRLGLFAEKPREHNPLQTDLQREFREKIFIILDRLQVPALFFQPGGQIFVANEAFFRVTGIPSSSTARWAYEFPLVGAVISGKRETLRLEGKEYRVLSMTVEQSILFLLEKVTEEEAWLSELQFFLTALGHELKTPLTVIRGYVQLLGEESGYQIEVAKKLQEQILRLETSLNNFRNLSFLGKKGFVVLKEAMEVVTFIVESWKGEMERKNLQWEYIPTAQNSKIVLGLSRGDFHLLFSNLFSNAVKFSVPGGKIAFSWTIQSERIFFELSNFLPEGISPQGLLKKWESFRKMKEFPEKNLGIYLIERTLEKIGGKLQVNFGSQGEVIFRVFLPSGDEFLLKEGEKMV